MPAGKKGARKTKTKVIKKMKGHKKK